MIKKIGITRILSLSFLLLIIACGTNEPEPEVQFGLAPENPDNALLVSLINEYRNSNQTCGSTDYMATGSVVWNDTLAEVATKHSEDMAARDELTHVGSTVASHVDRIKNSGYALPTNVAIENLAKGIATEEGVIQLWMESGSHCINIMDTRVKEVGVGTSGAYWTLIMASH